MWRYAVFAVLFLVFVNANEIQNLDEGDELDALDNQLEDSDTRPPRCRRSIDNCGHNSNNSCCLHFDCMRNYICCTNIEPKPSNCPMVIQRCCPPPPPPTYCQANFICCTNAEPKPQICHQVKPRCCPDPPKPQPPPPLPICQEHYICCTNTGHKPRICTQIIPQCCPKQPPIICPAPPGCPTPGPSSPLPYCQQNYKCCSLEEPKPYNCWQVIPRCCPLPPPPDHCPPTPRPPLPCPTPDTLPYCQQNYVCCTNKMPKPYNCPLVVPRCCPNPSCPPVPPPKPCPIKPYCQEHYICCTISRSGVKPRICLEATPICCPKGRPELPPVPPPIPQPYPICPGPCPYQPPPCMAGCPNYYSYFPGYYSGNFPGYYPGNIPGYYPGNMRMLPPQGTNGTYGRRIRRDISIETSINGTSDISNEESLNGTTTDSMEPCNCETFTNNSLVTVFVTSASQDSYKLLRNQIQIFKNNLKDAITVEILAYGNATSESECEFGEGDCLGNRLLSCASDMSEDDASIMGFATCIMSSSLLLTNGTQVRILTKAKSCASKHSYSWVDLRKCAMNGDGELLLKQAGHRQKEIDSSLEHVPAVYYNEEPVWSQSSEISEFPKLLCKHLIDVPAGRLLCQRMTFFNYGDLKKHLQKTQEKPKIDKS